MKAILLLFALLMCRFGFGQPTDTVAAKEHLTLFAEGKIYHFTQVRASYKDSSLFIQGSKPDEQNMFPVFQLFLKTDGQAKEYDSRSSKNMLYGAFRKGGQEMYNSQSNSGFCSISLQGLTKSHVKGSFSMTVYNLHGSSAMFLTGSFFLKFKKE